MSEYFLSFIPALPEGWVPTEFPIDPYMQAAYAGVALVALFLIYRLYRRLTRKRINNSMIFTGDQDGIKNTIDLKL